MTRTLEVVELAETYYVMDKGFLELAFGELTQRQYEGIITLGQAWVACENHQLEKMRNRGN
jgi:hypothetical protein